MSDALDRLLLRRRAEMTPRQQLDAAFTALNELHASGQAPADYDPEAWAEVVQAPADDDPARSAVIARYLTPIAAVALRRSGLPAARVGERLGLTAGQVSAYLSWDTLRHQRPAASAAKGGTR